MNVSGNPLTPEELLAERAWLRRLAIRIVSEVGLAEDAVQETMLAAIRRGPSVRGNLRGWLAAVLRNAVRRRARHDRRLEDREKVWARGQDWNRHESLDVSERFALEHDLSKAVHELEEGLRRVVLLRFLEGRSLREISERVGAPISTVDARLSRALALLRARLERSHGDGDEDGARFRAALLLYVGRKTGTDSAGRPLPWVPVALVSGVAGLLVLLALSDSSTPDLSPEVSAARPALARGREPLSVPTPNEARPDVKTSARRPLPVTTSLQPIGSAEIRFADSAGNPLAGLLVSLWPKESAHPFPPPGETDADGRVLFGELRPGAYSVATDRLMSLEIEVRPDARTNAAYTARELEIEGLVLDEFGTPLSHAEVWVSASPGGAYYRGAWTRGIVEAAATTRTDSRGAFHLSACGEVRLLGARAPGRAPSPPLRIGPGRDPALATRLVLAGAGGALEGRVLGPDGAPLADAVVLVEAFANGESADPLLATRSDGAGRFRLEGLATGERSVSVRAAGLATWRGSATVADASVAFVEAALERGASLRGVVRDSAGEPVAGAEVRYSSATGTPEPLLAPASSCRSGPDGSYTLAGLPPEEARLVAQADGGGRIRIDLSMAAGEERELDLFLAPARIVGGCLLDGAGEPLAGIALVLAANPPGEVARSSTDANGLFALSVFEPGELVLRAFEAGWPVLEERIEDASVDIRRVVADHARPRAFLRGGIPAAQGRLLLRSPRYPSHQGLEIRPGPDGRFEAGPLPAGELLLAWKGAECVQALDPGVIRLVAGEVRELGNCRVLAPGTVVLHLEGCGAAPLRVLVRGADGRLVTQREIGEARSDSSTRFSLAESDYTLQLWSETCAPLTLPLAVRTGEVTELHARPEPGNVCQILIEDPAGPRLRSLTFTLEDETGKPVLSTPIHPSLDRPGGGYRIAIGLHPGRYEVQALLDEEPALSSSFTVGTEGPQSIRLELE